MSPPHALASGDVATATNVDFGLAKGGLAARRGSITFSSPASSAVTLIWRNYNQPDAISSNAFYVVDAGGHVYTGTPDTLGGWSQIGSGAGSHPGINSFNQYAIIAGGTLNIKDDGTHTTDWVKQTPAKPTVTVSTLAPLDLTFGTATFAVSEGMIVSGSTTCTAVTSPNNRITFTLTLNSGSNVDLTTNGAEPLGDFGVHFIDLAFSDPTVVTRISQDFSVHDASFSSYWHAEILPQNAVLDTSSPDPTQLVDNFTTGGDPVTQAQRENMIASIRAFSNNSLAAITRLSTNFSPWAVAHTDFAFIGTFANTSGADSWKTITAAKYTIECNALCTASIASPQISGAENYPLSDINSGYTWWQTWATLDANGNKIGEGAASDPSDLILCQNAQAKVVSGAAPTGNHGITHLVTYRQGGFTRDAYAVSTVALATATITDTMSDIEALSEDFVMPRNVLKRSGFNGNTFAIAEPFQSRVFYAHENNIGWTLPGTVDTIPALNFAQISSIGDNVKAMVAWTPGLIIVNQYSVYELTGNDFEDGQFQLLRSGSRHGSIAPGVPIKTPHGIPLLSYEGLTMYVPGSSNEVELPWLMERYGDMFKGSGATDPAALKGNRIPAINRAGIINCSAAYADNRLYLAAPTGTDTTCHTLFVLDLAMQQVWWYTYSFAISAMFWDQQDARLFAGTTDGRLIVLERGVGDDGSAVQWNAVTRSWAAAADTVMENISVESDAQFVQLRAIYDSVNTTVVSTLTGSARQWLTPPLRGTYVNEAAFAYLGTGTGTIYQMVFDTLEEPVRVTYYRTPFEEQKYDGDKLWDVAYYDLENRGSASGNVSAITYVDGTQVMSNTIVAPWPSRQVFEFPFPAETYGRVAYTTFTASGTSVQFQHWDTNYDARPEPPKITTWRTDIESLDENICDAFDVDINPAGTVLATCYVDNVVVSTATIVGTNRQSYTETLPPELYGRTIYVRYNGAVPFKHYKTWYHLRKEPDRWTDYVTSKQAMDEHEWKVYKPELNCFGNIVLSTVFVDGTAVGTYTSSSTVRHQDIFSLPVRTFGRVIWAQLHAVSGNFKYYPSGQLGEGGEFPFEGDKEPPRVSLWRQGPMPFDSSHYLKTWQPQLDPLGGTVFGTLIVDDTVLTTGTFIGDRKQWFTVGLDLDLSNAVETGSRWEVIYSGVFGSVFKHYETQLESEAKPFGKAEWSYTYRKIGGASQLDMGRYFSLECESPGQQTAQYWWDVDDEQFTTGTLTLSAGVNWYDRLALPPGMRGHIFKFRMLSQATMKVYKVNIDLVQEGIKHLTRHEVPGTPPRQGGSIG